MSRKTKVSIMADDRSTENNEFYNETENLKVWLCETV